MVLHEGGNLFNLITIGFPMKISPRLFCIIGLVIQLKIGRLLFY